MSPQQKNILTLLVIANGLLFCCLGPALFIFANGDGSQSLIADLMPTRGSTLTPQPSVTPMRPVPTPKLEAGWKSYRVSTGDFSIAFPSTWVYQDLQKRTVEPALEDLKKKNPSLANWFEDATQKVLKEAGALIFAADLGPNSVVDNNGTILYLIHETETQAFSMDYWVGVNLADVENQPGVAKPVAHRRIQLPIGEAEQIRYTITSTNSRKVTVKTAITQYIMLHGKESYIVTFGTPPSLDAKYQPVFEKIIQTIRFVQ